MSRVHPDTYPSLPRSDLSLGREAYTIWMKSLVLHGYGLTVYNSGGEVAYRVDNYQSKNGDEACLMDGHGNMLFRIIRKKVKVHDTWEGHNCCDNERVRSGMKPAFKVTKLRSFMKGGRSSGCRVQIGCGNGNNPCYRIDGLANKSEYRMVDMEGRFVAEMKRKQTESGVVLGSDILRLVVEPNVDRSLVMAMVVVIGLINRMI